MDTFIKNLLLAFNKDVGIFTSIIEHNNYVKFNNIELDEFIETITNSFFEDISSN